MDDVFKIYVEQLREGHEEEIHEILDPSFLDIQETDLAFSEPVKLDGTAYLAEKELILRWNIAAQAVIPCSICNGAVKVDIEIDHFYHSEPLIDIKTGIYNFKNLLRETILLEVPSFAECCEGNCPKRQEYKKYLKEVSDQSTEEGYQPFADLDWKS